MKKYFVSYIWKKLFISGCGMSILSTEKSIGTTEGLVEVARMLADDIPARKVVILNYIEVGEQNV